MKKSILYLIFVGLFTSNTVFAQNCKQFDLDTWVDLLALTKLEQNEKVKDILNTYCYAPPASKRKMNEPFWFSKNIETLKMFEQKQPKIYQSLNNYNQDLLSAKLIEPLLYQPYTSEQIQINIFEKTIKKYNVAKETINDKAASGAKREEILNYLTTQYIKNNKLTKDVFNKNVLGYAIYMSEPKVLQSLLDSNNFNKHLFFKGSDTISSIHLAFAQHDASIPQDKIKQVNDIIVANIDKKHLPLLSIRALNFAQFVELMKDNNPDLYEKLNKKFNFNVSLSNTNPAVQKERAIVNYFLDIKKMILEKETKN